LNSKNRQLIYYGWLGYHNLGDEALYRAISSIFSSYSYKFVPIQADAFYGFNREYSPVTIVGGSTGIPDWMDCLRPTRYSYVFGAGVKDPSFYGYDYVFTQKQKVSVWKNRLKSFRYIGVRGEISKQTLAKWGIDSQVIGDPAFSLRPSESLEKAEKRIAINFGSDGILWGMNDSNVVREIASVIRILKKEGYEVILVPFNGKNAPLVQEVANQEAVSFFDNWFNVESTVNLLASCKLLIGERVHSLALSAAAGTPFVGIEFQPPCYEVAQSVGFEDYTIRTDAVSGAKILSLLNVLLENYEVMRTRLMRRVEMYRRKQAEFATQISQDIESLPENYWNVSTARKTINNLFWRADAVFWKRAELWKAWDSLLFSRTLKYLP
jgi:polysaccharide pyruvyl transferase WcaK-like protein